MNIIEERKLQKIIIDIENFKNSFTTSSAFFENINELEIPNIQEIFYQNDMNFFDDVSFILSVIASITNHPHLNSTGEDIIIRADLAGSISQESFQKVFKDPSLWKEKDHEMVPEYVHHRQYTDELKTYENIFIGMIINIIDNSLINYTNFYTNLIPSLNVNKKEFLINETLELVLNRIEFLKRKLTYIKNTYFYKEVSKCNLKLKNIVPTNILIKDRLYNYCYKFYKEFIKYTEVEDLEKDYQNYYFYNLLKIIKEKEFNFIKEENNNWYFNFKNFEIKIQKSNLKNINLTIKTNKICVHHNLIIDLENDEEIMYDNQLTSNDVISVWNLKDQFGRLLNQTGDSTKEILNKWLDSKLILNQAKKSLYTKYCPICKNHSIEEENQILKCSSCETEYTFLNNDTIWFCKLRSAE